MCSQRTSSLQFYVEKGHRTQESRRTEDFNEKAEEQKHLNKENFTSEEAAEKGFVASVHHACNFMLKKDIGAEKAEKQKHLNKENFTSEEAAEKGCVASVHQACSFMLHRLTNVAYCDLPQLWDTATARAWACEA
jgi:NTP pyrophosphatase (non-canonical NTP hydrolase)